MMVSCEIVNNKLRSSLKGGDSGQEGGDWRKARNHKSSITIASLKPLASSVLLCDVCDVGGVERLAVAVAVVAVAGFGGGASSLSLSALSIFERTQRQQQISKFSGFFWRVKPGFPLSGGR